MKRCSKRQFSNACSISGIFRLQLVILRIVKIRLREPGCLGHVSHITRTSQQIRILKTGFLGYAEVFAVVLPMVPWLYLQKNLTLTSNAELPEKDGTAICKDLCLKFHRKNSVRLTTYLLICLFLQKCGSFVHKKVKLTSKHRF